MWQYAILCKRSAAQEDRSSLALKDADEMDFLSVYVTGSISHLAGVVSLLAWCVLRK